MTTKDQKFLETILHGGLHSFLKRAIELGVKVEPLKTEPKVLKLTYKNKFLYIRSGTIPGFKMMGQFTKNKSITKAILADAGLAVPKGIVLERNEAIKKNIIKRNNLKFPLIVKPQNSSRAHGVTWNIQNIESVKKAVRKSLRESSSPTMIEEMFVGDEYRILVIDDKFISAVLKRPPTITGDGVSKVENLIKAYNQDRKPEHQLVIDREVKLRIKDSGNTLKSVPKKGHEIILKNTFLMSEGARLISVTSGMNKYYKDICAKAVSILNLKFGGVDLIAKDIRKPLPYVILEVNPNPFFNMHEKELVEGKAVDVSGIILAGLFPELRKKLQLS